MRRKLEVSGFGLLLLLGAAVAMPVAADRGTVPGAPWVELAAPTAFDAPEPNVRNRPAVLIETDFYVYGEGGGLVAEPTVRLTSLPNGFGGPVTVYLYWQDRVTEETMYFNAAQGLVDQPTDLFSQPGAPGPVQVLVPTLEDFVLFGDSGAFGRQPDGVPTATGQYQWVLELRRPDGGTVVARTNAMYSHVQAVVPQAGSITNDTTWTADNVYLLTAPVNVRAPATLTIEPGTFVLGVAATDPGTLIIRQGATLRADGNAMQPIVMTSDQESGLRGPGGWGGLVINGFAPTNQGTSPPPEGEGDSGPFGGDDPNDSSGVLRFVRIEFAGNLFSEQNELNGIALQGVGTGTVLEHLQVHFNQDDGIEFFGGTANAKWVLVTDAEDDSLDWTFGWTGKLQFFCALQRSARADHGIEADNFRENFDLEPRSNPTIINATFVGNGPIIGADDEKAGFLLRRGTGGLIKNFILTGFAGPAVGFEDETVDNLGGVLDLEFGIIDPDDNFGGLSNDPAAVDFLTHQADTLLLTDPQLANPRSPVHPDITPLPGSPARSTFMAPPSDGFFMSANYLGCVDPRDPWTEAGWITWSDN